MGLSDSEKRDAIKLIEQDKPLPDEYRCKLFADKSRDDLQRKSFEFFPEKSVFLIELTVLLIVSTLLLFYFDLITLVALRAVLGIGALGLIGSPLAARRTVWWCSDIMAAGRCSLRTESKFESLQQSLANFDAFQSFRQSTQAITTVVGRIEFMYFFLLTLIAFQPMLGANKPETLLTLAGFWLAAKYVGNFGQWSDPIVGRAQFYTFLIGTTANVALAILLAFVAVRLLGFWPTCFAEVKPTRHCEHSEAISGIATAKGLAMMD